MIITLHLFCETCQQCSKLDLFVKLGGRIACTKYCCSKYSFFVSRNISRENAVYPSGLINVINPYIYSLVEIENDIIHNEDNIEH